MHPATSTSDDAKPSPALALPPAGEGAPIQVNLSDGPQHLTDKLGPLVINKDGSTSRITNWDKMTPEERERTIRILSKRNRQRIAVLKEQQLQQEQEKKALSRSDAEEESSIKTDL